MPQKDNEGHSGPTVRRTVTMRGTIAEPDSGLRPRAGRKEAKESGAKEPEATPEPVHGPTVETPPSTAATSEGSSTPSTDNASTDNASTDTSSADQTTDEATSARKSDDQHDAGVGSLVATEGGSPPSASKGDGASDDGDEPPSGRPTKALLAAAGIGGALLIAIPFLVAGTNNEDDSEPAAQARQTSAHTMPTNDEDDAPGVYAPKSPSADKPSSKAKAKVKSKAPESPARPSQSPTKEVQEASRTVPKEGIKASPKRAVAPVDYSNKKNVLLKNVPTGKCADIPYYGKGKVDGPVRQYDCDGTDADNQIWNFEVRYKGKGPGSANLFQIRNGKDGLCMDLPYYGGADHGQEVTEFHCDGTTKDNQLWWLEKRGDKKFWIHNYASNQQCLAVKGARGTGDPRASLAIGPCRSNANHEWTF
ncbi:RICIN domain-containing protein [Streptomyces sp. Rer75]|uniref:RICIN domain-containing protein n=1 Tax=Streptomyces sp. Rer75 TaxID=2750011 RepID=UPI0015D06925|nr:RICIN domain-containing protein [Streptomyces sp. Rer75]QLH26639.1 ricin-type beta-trefoil lectin domain protein [Streptomyces sp. Rer75]